MIRRAARQPRDGRPPSRRPWTARLVPLALVVALSAAVGAARLDSIDASGSGLADGDAVAGAVHLLERPRPGPFGATAVVEAVDGATRGVRLLARLPREAALPAAAAVGTKLKLEGTFRRPEANAAAEPGGFDLAAHLRRRGIAGELEVDRAQVGGARRGGLAGTVDGIRERALAGISSGLPRNLAALGEGMVLGADDRIEATVRDDFRDSGLAHVLAASGQNVMLLVALAIPLLAAAGLPHRARIPILIALIALYVPLAGGGPSIQRAGAMGAVGLLAMLLSRPASRWYALALAACATLAANPRVWEEPGWQMSFAAVIGILALAPGIQRRLGALPRPFAAGVALTTAATLATAPLLAHHFGSVSLASLPANVVALALVAPIMWIGMLRAAVGQLGDGGAAAAVNGLLGRAIEPLLAGFERLAALFADIPGATFELRLAGPAEVALAYAAIATATLLARRQARRWDTRASTAVAHLRRLPRRSQLALAVSLAALVTLALARGLAPAGPPATLTVTFLDVGQGDATLVQHPDGSAVLFDGGPPEGGVARLLRRAGVRRLSALVMTHASRDHHGGLAEVVERFPVDLLLDGGDGTRDRDFQAVAAAARARGVRRVRAVAPLVLRAGALRIDVLSPPPRPPGPPPEDPNPRAVVAIVSSDGFDLLLSGDAESDALLPLPLPDVDAIKVPHHGSADRGLPDVLDRLRPELAAIPVGENGYGHPAPSTLAALRAADVPTWRTDRHGSIRVAVDRGRMTVEAGP